MILFAAGMVTGAFVTLVVSLILAARSADEHIFKSETLDKGHR